MSIKINDEIMSSIETLGIYIDHEDGTSLQLIERNIFKHNNGYFIDEIIVKNELEEYYKFLNISSFYDDSIYTEPALVYKEIKVVNEVKYIHRVEF